MSDEVTIESFAADLAQADKPEQPAKADSGAADSLLAGEDLSLEDAPEAEAQAEAEGEQSEQPEADSDQAEPVHKWTTANGETVEATESELRAGYLRTQDYTQKTQQAAETIRQSQAQIQQERQIIGALSTEVGEINALQQQVAAFNGIDWAAADAQDPQAADRARIRLMTLKQQLGDAQSRAASKADQLRQMTDQQFQQSVSAAEKHLSAKLPDLKRPEIEKVFSRMAALGATSVELHHMRAMPWLVEAAVYANRYLDLKATKSEVQNKVRKLPPPTTSPRAAVPASKTEATLKAINSQRSFSTNEFAQLLKATR